MKADGATACADKQQQQHQQQQQQPMYSEQLRQIMFGLGDFPEPGADSVRLIEDFLRLRLSRWAAAAAAAAADERRQQQRDGADSEKPPSEVTAAALVAALRPNRRALAHCIRYHRLLAETVAASASGGNGEGVAEDADVDLLAVAGGEDGRQQSLPPYLEAVAPEASEALAQLQAERQQRLQRLSRCSERLSPADYERFARSRRCCLVSRGLGFITALELRRFRTWLGPTGRRLDADACRLLGHLAHQTVAELLDAVKRRRAEAWPPEALLLEAEICASTAELREVMQLRAAASASAASDSK